MSAPPESFRRLYDFACDRLGKQLRRTGRRGAGRDVILLPPTTKQLAEVVEQSEPFSAFARDLPPKGHSHWRVSAVLRRSGFYHATMRGDSALTAWRRIARRFQPYVVHARQLLLLDGCVFPQERFSVLGFVVERLSLQEIAKLGPSPEICHSFFPGEQLNGEWFSQQWFLRRDRKPRERRPGAVMVRLQGPDIVGLFWKPLLALGLYNVSGFHLPMLLESEREWKLMRLIDGEPMVDHLGEEGIEVPTSDYEVTGREAGNFRRFLRFVEKAVAAFRDETPIALAARRYLRAMLIEGPLAFRDGATRDESEDALLQYVFAMEGLLLPGEREALADKLATRAALLVGQASDEKRLQVYRHIKQLYGARSDIVHGSKASQGKTASDLTRDVARRVLVAALALRLRVESDDEWRGALRDLAVSQRLQGLASSAAGRAFALLKSLP